MRERERVKTSLGDDNASGKDVFTYQRNWQVDYDRANRIGSLLRDAGVDQSRIAEFDQRIIRFQVATDSIVSNRPDYWTWYSCEFLELNSEILSVIENLDPALHEEILEEIRQMDRVVQRYNIQVLVDEYNSLIGFSPTRAPKSLAPSWSILKGSSFTGNLEEQVGVIQQISKRFQRSIDVLGSDEEIASYVAAWKQAKDVIDESVEVVRQFLDQNGDPTPAEVAALQPPPTPVVLENPGKRTMLTLELMNLQQKIEELLVEISRRTNQRVDDIRPLVSQNLGR